MACCMQHIEIISIWSLIYVKLELMEMLLILYACSALKLYNNHRKEEILYMQPVCVVVMRVYCFFFKIREYEILTLKMMYDFSSFEFCHHLARSWCFVVKYWRWLFSYYGDSPSQCWCKHQHSHYWWQICSYGEHSSKSTPSLSSLLPLFQYKY